MKSSTIEGSEMEGPTEAPTAERRGDRRAYAGTWRCRGQRPADGPHPSVPTVPCGAGPERRTEDAKGTVWCSLCGTVDARSTVGNRRRARAELEQLERRIERELHELRETGEILDGRLLTVEAKVAGEVVN